MEHIAMRISFDDFANRPKSETGPELQSGFRKEQCKTQADPTYGYSS
jgi:hypothetical protein